jgi:Ferric reductase like transmembrane component
VNSLTWEVARAGGFVAYGLVTLSVIAGLALGLRVTSRRWPRFVTNEVHRFLTLTALVFVGLHVLAVGIDPFTHFGPTDVLVPFGSWYRTVWMGLGVVAFYLALAVWISTLMRRRIGFRWWKRLHFAAFAVYAAATLHGLATGTDTRTAWGTSIYAVSLLAVGGLSIYRAMGARTQTPRPLAAACAAAVLGSALVWAVAGPLQTSWGHRPKGVGGAVAKAARPERPGIPAGVVRAPFAATFRGRLAIGQADEAGLVTLRIDGALHGGTHDHLEILLHGVPLPGGGVQLEGSRVLLGAARPVYRGSVDALRGSALLATVRSERAALRLGIVLKIGRTGAVLGRIRGERV